MLERFIKEPYEGPQYLGTVNSQPCLNALRTLLQQQTAISRVRLLTELVSAPRHAFLITTEIDELIAIRPGFTSGYLGEGPRALASALLLLDAFGFHVDEHVVSSRIIDRIVAASLTSKDIKEIDAVVEVRPTRLHEYIFDAGMHGRTSGQVLRAFEPVMPYALIDDRISDLALDFLGIRIFWLIGSYHDDGTNHQLSGLPG